MSTGVNKTIVHNLDQAIVKKTTIKISGHEVMSVDDSDVYHCSNDLWKTTKERENAHFTDTACYIRSLLKQVLHSAKRRAPGESYAILPEWPRGSPCV